MSALKYRFVAGYDDGTEYEQNDADVSVSNPTKSCYYDVDHGKLVLFDLVSWQDRVRVNLLDGGFWIQWRVFFMHDRSENLTGFRLVYSRRNEIEYDGAMNEIGHKVTYRLGWTAKRPDGTEIERVMEVE